MDTALIETSVRSIISKLGLPVDGIEVSEAAGSTIFTIRTIESGKLIGKNGETLSALNHIVKKMLEKEVPRDFHFVIDVNGYHHKKIKSLEDQAKLVAERARTFRYDVELPPMNAYERMIIHATLKDATDIQTMSHGEGPLRHIVVRYIDPTIPQSPASLD
ncbi:KH domain-containing protein [Patescibacteria group bacterium]|nr:KH domain-containing protein [Patescibacteria group bacterium]